MAEKNLIKQIKVEDTVHDLGGSIYNLDEVSSSTTEKDGVQTTVSESSTVYATIWYVKN